MGYGNGIIGATYESGSVITIGVDITASHAGHFEFKLCANNDVNKIATQECLDENFLDQADGVVRISLFLDKVKSMWDITGLTTSYQRDSLAHSVFCSGTGGVETDGVLALMGPRPRVAAHRRPSEEQQILPLYKSVQI